jgi:hypothetical protein
MYKQAAKAVEALQELVNTGKVKQTIPLDRFKLPTLLQMAAAASTGVFGLVAGTFGSASAKLIGEASNSSAKTSIARCLYTVPANYVADTPLSVVIHAGFTATTVNTTKSIDLSVCVSDKEAGVKTTMGADGNLTDLVTTAAQSLAVTMADKTFALDCVGLRAGDVLDIQITTVFNDTHATGVAEIGSVVIGPTAEF